MIDQGVERVEGFCARCHRQAGLHRPGEEFLLGGYSQTTDIPHAMAEKSQRPRGTFPWVEQPDAAGGDVAGVGKRGQPLSDLLLVEHDEV